MTATTLAFDGVLIAFGVLSVAVAWKLLRGRISRGLIVAALGLVLLSFAHLSETLLGIYFDFMGEGRPELVHRILVLLGFLLLVYGLARIGDELRRESERAVQAETNLVEAQEELRVSSEALEQRSRELEDARAEAAERSPIRVILVESNPDLRRLLTILLAEEGDMQVVGQAANGQEALTVAGQVRPDIVLIDDALASRDEIAALKSAREDAQVIVLATYPGGLWEALAASASDYVLIDSGSERVVSAIRRAAQRGIAVESKPH